MANVKVRTRQVIFKVTPEQYQRILQRAEQCGVRPTQWMRSILLQAANRTRLTSDGFLRIKEPDGATT